MRAVLKHGDCLELMKNISDKSVDMVLCDLPYGTTRCEWDIPIPFDPLWEQYNRIIKDNGAILLFSAQPFTTDLINSNRKMFRYEIIWEKTTASGVLNARRMPLKIHENILIFYKHLPTYNPQMVRLDEEQLKYKNAIIGRGKINDLKHSKHYGKCNNHYYTENGMRFPKSIVAFSSWNGALFGNNQNAVKHPTTKPVDLLEYLIKTYTTEGDTVLDNCMVSGSTGVACVNSGRNFIGMELNKDYFEIAKERVNSALADKEDQHEN